MPIYSYTGITDKGKKAQGTIDAPDEKAARSKLRKMGVFPTVVSSSGAEGAVSTEKALVKFEKLFERVSTKDVSMLTRQLAILVSANIALVDSLHALVEQTENKKLKGILTDIRERVTEGVKLSDAMRRHPKVFGEIYANMVDAGENSGALDIVLSRLADFMENQNKIRSRVVGAMVYPVIMGVVGVALMCVLLIFMVPRLLVLFKGQHMILPIPTRILIFISTSLTSYWYIFLILILLGALFIQRWFKKPSGREFRDKLMLQLPLFGRLIKMVSISRFARTLATLLSGGVPMLMAMDVVKNVVDNVHIRRAVEETRTSVKEGESVAEPLRRSGHFPPIVTHMIAIGEKTGDLEKMLERIADTYDSEVDGAISTLLSLLEPVMILVMGGAVTFVVVSILLPILQMGDLGALGK